MKHDEPEQEKVPAMSKNLLIHAVYDEIRKYLTKEEATYAARRIVEICRPDAKN